MKTDKRGFSAVFAGFFNKARIVFYGDSNDITRRTQVNHSAIIDATFNQFGKPGNHLNGMQPTLTSQMISVTGQYKQAAGPNSGGVDNPQFMPATVAAMYKKRRQL